VGAARRRTPLNGFSLNKGDLVANLEVSLAAKRSPVVKAPFLMADLLISSTST